MARMEQKERPVLTGLVALVAVAAVIGVLLGAVALLGSRVLGVGGSDVAASGATAGDSLYLPDPVATTGQTGPEVTLAPGDPTPTDTSTKPGKKPPKPQREISLSSGQTSVGSFQRIDLTGTYDLGTGTVLQVQRRESGTWRDFPVALTVSGDGSFSTYIKTSHSGLNVFRVMDKDTNTHSNPVKVQVG